MYDEIELREKTQEEINEIEKLRKKRDDEFIDLLIKLDTDKKYIEEELILIEIKLKNLKMSEKKKMNAIRSKIIGHF